MMWTRSTPSTRRRRVVPMARDPLDATDAGRGAPVLAAAAGEDAGQEVQDAHVPLRRGHVPLRRELLLRAQRRLAPRGTQNSLRAVDAKAGRSARRRSSGRSSPTSRRASRPTSWAGSSGSAPSATAAASRRPSSRSSSSRSCASRARSRPRPRCCWRRRRRHRHGACRRRRRTPTCCPRWRCRRARCRDRRRTPRGRRTPRCRGRRVGTACHRPSFYLEATTPRRHRGRRFLGTRLNATRRRGRRDTRTARRRRALGRILGRGRRTTRARRRGLLSESLPAKFWIRMLLCHQSTRV